MSGNTFGAKFFSDTKRVAPMLPKFPQITICPKCNTIFWLSKSKAVEVEEYDLFDDWRIAKIKKPKWWWGKRKRKEYKEREEEHQRKEREEREKYKPARFLHIDEYVLALQNKDVCSSKEDEYYIRLKLWHTFNDRIRNGQPLFENDSEKKHWEDNCRQLIALINSNKGPDKVMIAELKRNLGEFEEAVNLLDSIRHRGNEWWVIDQIKAACEKKNTLVFRLDTTNSEKEDPKKKLPRQPSLYEKSGQKKEKCEDYQGALEDYDKAILENETDAYPYVLKAGIYEILDNQVAILECLNKAIAIDEDCADAYINRALYHRHHKNFQEAQKDYEKTLSLEPSGFNIVLFNEEDMVKYNDNINMVDFPGIKQGTLAIDLYLSPNTQGDTDTSLFVEVEDRLYPIVLSLLKKQKEIIGL
jgi:tetratricopeptide (TPR) repeat protein